MMHVGQIIKCDVANGEGIRCSVFVSGCRNRCKGCFNECTWDFDYGMEYTQHIKAEIIDELSKPFYDGLTILGGEPFEQENQSEVADLITTVKETLPDKTIWVYTGYQLDRDLVSGGRKCTEYTRDILDNIDILVDGRFILEQKNIALKYKGSENQRIIDMNKTNMIGRIVLSPLNDRRENYDG